jgi:hypothetical protein
MKGCTVKNFLCLLLVTLWIVGNTTLAQVTRAEQRLSEELAATLSSGNAVQLGQAEQPFLGIFLEAQGKKSRGGIIFLHDLDGHADWPDVISPLRQSLPRYGWHTLSIQLPTAPAYQATRNNTAQWQSLEEEISRRIQAAIAYCHNKRIFNLVLIGHQYGAVMAGRFTAKQSADKAISALAAINLISPTNPLWTDGDANRELATSINIAFLDIVPDRSPQHVLDLAENRKTAMTKPGYDKYKQIHIIGADYTFRGAEQTLISRIRGWLTKLAPSMEVQMTPSAIQPVDATQ